MGEDGEPMDGQAALELLRDTGALQELRNRGYQGVQFTTMVPSTTEPEPVRGKLRLVTPWENQLSALPNS